MNNKDSYVIEYYKDGNWIEFTQEKKLRDLYIHLYMLTNLRCNKPIRILKNDRVFMFLNGTREYLDYFRRTYLNTIDEDNESTYFNYVVENGGSSREEKKHYNKCESGNVIHIEETHKVKKKKKTSKERVKVMRRIYF